MVDASDLRPERQEFDPWPAHLRCVLRQNTQLSQSHRDEYCTDEPSGSPSCDWGRLYLAFMAEVCGMHFFTLLGRMLN